MYAFIDLKTRMFIQKDPDEAAPDKQRSQLERQLARVAKAHSESVVGLIHWDDKTDVTDWVSPVITGPRGSAALVEPEVPPGTVDYEAEIKKLYATLPTELNAAHIRYTQEIAGIHKKHQAAVLGVLHSRGGKGKPAYVKTAGYLPDGSWLEIGAALPKTKKKG